MRDYFVILWAILATLGGVGCQSYPTPYPEDRLIAHRPTPPRPPKSPQPHQRLLSAAIREMSPAIDPSEAHRAASESIQLSKELAQRYGVRCPAPIHNAWVNLGIKKKGLCYHYADALRLKLESLNFNSMDIHRAIALQGTWREHNAVVLTPKGAALETGLLLDAWRYRGALTWNRVVDSRYPWRPTGVYPEGFWETVPAWRRSP